MYWYQDLAINTIKGHWEDDIKKILLKLPTGGGKTHIFCEIIKRAAANGKRCIMVVRGRELVEQASQRLFREGVHHGVRMAGHWNKRYHALVQVCSIDTLFSRKDKPEADLIVIDEAHMATSDGYHWLMENYPNAYVVAVTATPYTTKSLEHVAQVVVNVIGMKQLIDEGFLVPPRYFAPSTPDLSGVRIQKGDYANFQLEERMSTLTGDIVGHWRELGDNRPTICFAVNVHHSQSLVEAFNRAGIPSAHVEAGHSDAERKALYNQLKTGQIKVLSNVGILCTGVDLPHVGTIIMARPTKSFSLYIQQAGRGTRTCAEIGKKDFILLDHAGNVIRHGFITQERDVDLSGRPPKDDTGPQPHTCLKCYAIFEGPFCLTCGPKTIKIGDDEITVDETGTLKEISDFSHHVQIQQFITELKEIRKKKGYKRGWVYWKVKERYGDDVAEQFFPKRSVPWFVQSAHNLDESYFNPSGEKILLSNLAKRNGNGS